MRYIVLLLLALLSACRFNDSPNPSLVSKPDSTPLRVATAVPSSSPVETLGSATDFSSALRPEFRGDLETVQSPTVYQMDLSLPPALDSLTGTETVTYTNRTGTSLNDIYFRLFANQQAGGSRIEIKRLTVDGAEVLTQLAADDTALKVPMPSPLADGSHVRMDLNWIVSIPFSNTQHYSDLTLSPGIVTLPSVYPLIPAHDDQGWHIEEAPDYGDLVNAEAALFDVRVTAPSTATVIASGTTVGTQTNGSSTVWHFVAAPARDFDLDIGPHLQKTSKQVTGVMINSYYLPDDEKPGREALLWASDALDLYQKRIGPYPFRELDVVETPTTAGGIEYPGVIVIAQRLYRDDQQRGFFEFAVAHEVAHQWFYSQVGDDQVNTPWMDESLVQFITYIYEKQLHGDQQAEYIRQNVYQGPYDKARKEGADLPIGLPVSAYNGERYVEIVYGKGPLFFQALYQDMGEAKFFEFLTTYYQRFKYKIAHPEDMLGVMKEFGGPAVEALYNQWVRGQ